MGSRASCLAPQAGGEEKAMQAYLFTLEEHYDTSGKGGICLRDGIRTAPNARGRRRILLQ
jgi:hypothetical protein